MTDVTRMIVAADGRLLAGTASGEVFEFSAANPSSRVSYAGLEGSDIRSLYVASDAGLIMASDSRGRAYVWDRLDGTLLDRLVGTAAVIQCAAFAPHHYLTVDKLRRAYSWTPHDEDLLAVQPVLDRADKPVDVDRFGASTDGSRIVLLSGFRWGLWNSNENLLTNTHKPIDGLQLAHLSGTIGLSANGRFFYTYWDDYLVFDTESAALVRERSIMIDPRTSDLSGDGELLAVGAASGDLVVVGPDGTAVFEAKVAKSSIVQVSAGEGGRIVAFVDRDGGAGFIEAGRVTTI